MADYSAATGSGADPANRLVIPNQVTGVHNRVYPTTPGGDVVPSDAPSDAAQWYSLSDAVVISHDYVGMEIEGPGQFFFEMIHYMPTVIALGNILTTVLQEIEIYNAYRDDDHTLTSATPNAGPGVSFIGLPGLPVQISTQTSLLFDVQVTTVGPASIDGTLDFVTDVVSFSIVITGDRVVMFAHAPENGILEKLKWFTDINKAADGTEQRISVRKNPRQSFEMLFRIEEGSQLRKMQALLKGWHPGVFGIPVWTEYRRLGADATAGTDTITVDTRYGDFRAGSLAIVWQDENTFDALQIDSFTETSITFTSDLTQNFDTEALVMPLRLGYLSGSISADKYINNLMDVRLNVRIIDNDVGSIGDTSAFSVHNSKVLLDDPNVIKGSTVEDGLTRDLISIDSPAANELQLTLEETSKVVTAKGFSAGSLQEVWQIRQLVHALRGSQVSFYLPTFYEDLALDQNLSNGSVEMDIESVDYADHIQAKEPYKSIWIELNDGTVLTREVLAYVTISDTVERLTVDTQWPYDINKDDVARISFCQLVRIANDEVRFEHERPGEAEISFEVIGVGE